MEGYRCRQDGTVLVRWNRVELFPNQLRHLGIVCVDAHPMGLSTPKDLQERQHQLLRLKHVTEFFLQLGPISASGCLPLKERNSGILSMIRERARQPGLQEVEINLHSLPTRHQLYLFPQAGMYQVQPGSRFGMIPLSKFFMRGHALPCDG